jgi:phage/plasmid primase, P4 family, C-terminal domain
MREARDLFYERKIEQLMDSHIHILCFNNGVIDFDSKCFREGVPEDYNSKSTNIEYQPLDRIKHADIIAEINEFLSQLFPIPELRRYMFDHLASCLIGKNENQTFNIYNGVGRNGKSALVSLMYKILGDYTGSVPITLLTQKRGLIGGTSSEVVNLRGTRYAVMQESTKGDQINEGVMKELTGGDKITARGLYKDAVTFIPQFKLVMMTNNLFDIKSNDDGTWRRIRICEFLSLFTETPVEGDKEKPYQFKVDKKIDKKFDIWAPIFMAMLVERAFETQGIVEDCEKVLASSAQYRADQDYLAE